MRHCLLLPLPLFSPFFFVTLSASSSSPLDPQNPLLRESPLPPTRPAFFSPDFIFDYGDYLGHPEGVGTLPQQALGKRVAVVGAGLSGLVTAYEAMRVGLHPVVFEAHPTRRVGGRMRSVHFKGFEENATYAVGELGAMRYDRRCFSGVFHYINKLKLPTRNFPDRFDYTSSMVDDRGIPEGEAPIYLTSSNFDSQPLYYKHREEGKKKAFGSLAHLDDITRARNEGKPTEVKSLWNSRLKAFDSLNTDQVLWTTGLFDQQQLHVRFGRAEIGALPRAFLDDLRAYLIDDIADFRMILGGCQRLAEGIWRDLGIEDDEGYWSRGTTLSSLHEEGRPRKGVVGLRGVEEGRVEVEEEGGLREVFDAVVFTGQFANLGSRVAFDERLLPREVLSAVRSAAYDDASKLFVLVDSAFWKQLDNTTSRDLFSRTFSDRSFRAVYAFEAVVEGHPSVLCLAYTWGTRAEALRGLNDEERLEIALREIAKLYPTLDIKTHIIAPPVSIVWSEQPNYMGAWTHRAPLRYATQRSIHLDFARNRRQPNSRGSYAFYIAGGDVSWGPWSEATLGTAVNALWGILKHFGGHTHSNNRGPGDVLAEWGPVDIDVSLTTDDVEEKTGKEGTTTDEWCRA